MKKRFCDYNIFFLSDTYITDQLFLFRNIWSLIRAVHILDIILVYEEV